jgi:hypothetical protein
MDRRRTALVVLASTALALGLSGCDKPNPGASVFSGTTSTFQRAVCWSHDDQKLDATTCAEDAIAKATAGGTVTTIPVVAGQTIGISVDPVVADTGWFPVIGGQRLTTQPITSTYYRFSYPGFDAVPADGLTLQVVAGDGAATRGLWVFKLVAA